jgi:hypothetical protein
VELGLRGMKMAYNVLERGKIFCVVRERWLSADTACALSIHTLRLVLWVGVILQVGTYEGK